MSLSIVWFFALLVASPATAPSDQIRTWFNQLADSNPETREQARTSLMGIDRRELPALRQIIAETRPLRPSQAAVLHDIVTHVYLAGEPYKRQPNGFLGVKLPPASEPAEPVVLARVPGFVAFRMLRDGDVIVGIAERPEVNFTNNGHSLSAVLSGIPAGTRVTLQIIRNGQSLSIPIRLDARPFVADVGPAMNEWEAEREEKASKYWAADFAPLLEESGVTASHP